MLPAIPPPATPAANEPGTLGQQFAAVAVSLYLGDRRGTSAEMEWHDARALAIPHASSTMFVSEQAGPDR